MANLKQFALPDLGEGLTEGEILKWLVAPGETVRLNQPIVEVETAKAAVEVPSPYAGVVTALHHQEGETVDVGSPIITVDTEPAGGAQAPGGAEQRAAAAVAAGAAANPKETSPAALLDAARVPEAPGIPAALMANPPDEEAVEPGTIGGAAPGGRTSVLVGYGPKSATARRRPRRPPAGPVDPAVGAPVPAADGAGGAGTPAPPPARVSAAAVGERAAAVAQRGAVLAKPPVRKLARDLGVDLARLVGTGPNGTITRSDVSAAADGPGPASGSAPTGGEQRIPVRGVRRSMAQAMVSSAFTAPHVTIWATADVTPSMELLDRLRSRPEFAAVKLSPLLLLARALLLAVRRHPLVNSSWDEGAQEIVVKEYVNLGIAAATPRGLLVPNIKDAGRMALPELAAALADLTATARDGRTAPADLAGGTITITNVGVLGMDTGTPILNPGESAILCFGVVRPTPWVNEGEIAVRQVTSLSLSFDHRHIDGRLGADFLRDVAGLLADPTLFAVWG